MKHQCCVEEMLDRTDRDADFMKKKIMFSDEAKFHVSGKVHRHNVKIWRTENPHTVRQHICESPKIKVWCGSMRNQVTGNLLFQKATINMNIYLDMLQL
jgi:hypothetical protein